jgi:phosphoserine phosphatase
VSDAYYPLAQADATKVLSLTELSQHSPLNRGPDALLCRLEANQLMVCQGHMAMGSALKLVIFGQQLSGDSLYTVLLALCAFGDSPLSLQSYQPVEQLAPAAVISGFNDVAAVKSLITELAPQLEIEMALVDNPPNLAQPGVLLMDMDSTAIEIECIDEIAVLAGVGEEVAAVTRQAMQGELDFAQSLRQRVGALQGADESILASVAATLPLMPGLEALVAHLQHKGWQVAIASGGFTYFTEHLKSQLGLTATFANQLEIVDGKLTGQVLGDIVDADTKAQVIESLAQQYDIDAQQTVAIGDGANDLKMLNKAALGVAFHAKPIVRQQAQAAINQGSLMQLLYLLLPAQ